jgi:hypothetical protein
MLVIAMLIVIKEFHTMTVKYRDSASSNRDTEGSGTKRDLNYTVGPGETVEKSVG